MRGAFLSFAPGLTVLYGLNGAGKSRVLRSIRDTLSGRESGTRLLVRVPPLAEDDWGAEVPKLLELLSAALAPERDDNNDPPDPPDAAEHYRTWVLRHLRSIRGPDLLQGELSAAWERELLEALLGQRYVLLRGTGHERSPRWGLELCMLNDGSFSAITAEFDRMAQAEAFVAQAADATADTTELEAQLWESFAFEATPATPENFFPADIAKGTLGSWTPIAWNRLALPIDMYFDLEPDSTDLDALTAKYLARAAEDAAKPRRKIRETATALTDRANAALDAALPDPPPLELNIGTAEDWLAGTAPGWVAKVDYRRIPIGELSRAEQRWARWAIQRAHYGHSYDQATEVPELLLFDEPEAALHRAAEANLARTLSELGQDPFKTVLVATHSPNLLDDPQARLFEVRRNVRDEYGLLSSRLTRLHSVERDALHRLGLEPSDLLARQRVFILVEGAHDEAVLRNFIGPQLEAARARILALRGAKNLPHAIESEVLFSFTDAHVITVLDNIKVKSVSAAWESAVVAAASDSPAKAKSLIDAALPRRIAEARWLGEWLKAAITSGNAQRVTPWGLSKPDIIDYLPADAFVRDADTDWGGLRSAYAKSTRGQGQAPDFKSWLRATFGADVSLEHIDAVSRDVATVPREFRDLLRLVERVSRDT